MTFFRQPDCELNPAKEFQSSPPRRAGAAETRSTSLSLADPNNFQTEKRRGVSLLAIACYKRNSHTSGSLKRRQRSDMNRVQSSHGHDSLNDLFSPIHMRHIVVHDHDLSLNKRSQTTVTIETSSLFPTASNYCQSSTI
jgi:hypothetical protein